MKPNIIIVLLFCIVDVMTGQSIKICGYSSDTVCTGVMNRIQFEASDCENTKVKIIPNTSFNVEDCIIYLYPEYIHNQYLIILTHSNQKSDFLTLNVEKGEVELALIIDEGKLPNTPTLTTGLAKELKGITIISNCFCLKEKSRIISYTMTIVRNGKAFFWENINSETLSKSAMNALSNVKPGDIVYFEEISHLCPGDDGALNNSLGSIVIKIK